MSNSPIESPKILFRAKSKIATLNMHKSQESNLFFESMSNLSKAQADEILSPNPIQDILNRDIGDNDLSLGMSPQLRSLGMSPQLQSPQFQLRSMMLQKASSKHFEDSIDLKENESPTIQPLPMVNESPKKDFLDSINIGEKPPVSGTLKGSQMFFYPNQNYPETDTLKNSEASFIDNSSPTLNGIKNSGYLMQSPQLDALEKYINKEEEKDKEKVKDNSKSDSRPGSGDSFLENNSPYKSKQISISPMKKFQKNLDEEKLTLVENIIKEEEEKKEIDQEFKNNELEMNNSKLKIDDEIKKGHLNKIKSIENVDDIVEFKKIYHNFFYLNNLLKKIYWKYLFYNLVLDKIFAKCCSFYKGRIIFSKYLLVIAILFSITMIGFIFGTNDAEYKTRSRTIHEFKKYLAANLIKGSLITTYYGVFFVQIRYYFILVLLFFVQFIPCFIVLLNLTMECFVYKSISAIPPDEYLPAIFFAGLFLFWLLVFFIKEDVKRNFSETKKIIFVLVWFVFGAAILAGITIYQLATSKTVDIQWYHDYISTICLPYVVFICINWVYLHVRFIVPIIRRPRRRTELPLQANHTLEQQKNKFETLKITNRNIMSKKSIGDFLNVSEKMDENSKKTNRYRTTVLFLEKFLKKFSRFLISIASFSIFGSIISTIVYCLFYILHETNQYLTISAYSMNNSAVICCSMLVLIIPMMFLVGIPLIASNLDLKNKLFLFPIFGLVLPICITLPIANSLQHDSNFLTFTSYLIYGPPFISIFWLFLIYMSQHGRKILFFVTTFFCLFFVVPLAFLSPLINTDGFLNMDSARAGMAILLTVGSFILLLYLVYLCLRKFGQSYILTKEELAKQPKFQFFNYLRQNCENFGLFGNGVGFIITITILIYGIFNKPSYIKPSQDGSLAGLVIVVCLLFIFLTMIIRMPILNPQKVYTQSINDQFEKEFIPERRNLIKRQGIIRLIVIIFGFVIVPLILVPIIIVKRDEDDTKYLLLTALIGNFCVVIIFQLFYSIKKSYEEFGKSLIPGLSIFCWLFVFIPFVAIIPITIVNLSPEEDIALLYKITVGVAAMFIFLGVGILAIIGNLFFKRIEFEKKFKFVASKLIKLLKKHHVRSDYDVIRLAYDDYLTRGPNKSEENMKKAKPIYYIKTSKFNPQIEYSKILISEANFRKLKKCQGRTTEQLEDEKINLIEKKKNCLNALINTCCPLDELGENNDKMKKLKSLKSDEYLNNLISKETEEEVLSQSSEDDQIYDHKKSNKPKNNNDGELGEAFNDILVNNIIKNNKDDENIDLVKDLQNLKNLKAKDLDPRIWNALKFYDFTDNLGVNEKQQIDLLKVIFKMFALGDRKIVNMPWIDYVCFKELLRLSKIIPCDEIPDFMIDLTYTQFTNNNSSEFCNPIVEYNLKEILARIAEMKYPDDLKEDAYNKLLRYYIFPLILWNMPEMQLYYPHEWEYVLFLMKLHNLNGNSDFILQKKKENEKLLKKMQGMLLVEKYEDDEKDSMKQINLEKESAQEDDKELLEKEILKMNKEKEEGRRISNELFVIELNQKQLEMEKQKKIEKERKDKERKKIVKYWICIKLNKLWVFFFQSLCFIQTRNEDDDEDENKENEADFHYAVDTLIAISNKKRSYSHLESPPWPDLVHLMVSFFPEAEEEYIKKKIREESLELQKNITNFMAILSKIFEMYSMGSIALRSQIEWNLSPGAQTVLNSLNNNIPLSDFPKFKFFFWLSFGISVCYWFVGYQAVKKIQKGTFGVVSGKKSAFNKDFILNTFINVASSTMYMIIMKSFIDAFSCNYDVNPWTLYEDPTIICNEGTHYLYIFLAVIGVLLYYPLSSFLFPNIQFQNKSLDLKYDPTFIVILTQMKLLISGTASFFPVGTGLIIQLTVSTIALLFLALIDKIMKPCLVKKHNILEVGGYLIAAWMCFSGLINVLTGDAFIATILIIVGSIAIGIFTIIFYIKYLKKIKKQKENRKKIKMIESPILDQSCSPINSPIFALDSLKKIPYDVSKKVNEFENFSLGSSPLQLHGENHNNKDFKIQIKELEKPQVDSDTGNEHENIIGEPVQVQEEEKE